VLRFANIIFFCSCSRVAAQYFSECVTIQPDPSASSFLVDATSYAYNRVDFGYPLAGPPDGTPAPFTDLGPGDHGAGFDFKFGPLDAGDCMVFNIYYGAAASQADAEDAVSCVDAEVYAFAKPSIDGVCTGKFVGIGS
jgi:hypothetical protein